MRETRAKHGSALTRPPGSADNEGMRTARWAFALLPVALALGACGDAFKTAESGTGGAGATTSTTSTGGGGGSGGSGGQGGSEPSCEPGVMKTCYEGPEGTGDVGACAPGLTTCAADGSGYGPCEGQILPSPETCGDDVDENCDGDLCPALAWMNTYGNSFAHRVHGVAVDASNGIYAVGAYRGSVDYGKGPLAAGTDNDMFVLKVDASGNTLDAKNYGIDPFSSAALDAAVLPDASLVVAGVCDGVMAFGGPALATQGQGDACFVQTSSAGAYKRSNVYGDSAAQTADSVAGLSNGDLVLGGRFDGTIAFAGNIALSGSDAGFAARIGANFGVWGLRIDGVQAETPVLVAALPNDEVIVAAGIVQPLTLGAIAVPHVGGVDVLVAKLDANGGVVWAKSFGDGSDQSPSGLATDAAGRIVLVGLNRGVLGVGSTNVTATDKQDGFAATFDANGNVVWGVGLGGPEDQWTSDVAFAPDGSVLVSGFFTGSLELEGQSWPSAGGQDAFVAKLGPEGHLRWAVPFASPTEERARALAYDATGGIVVAGTFESIVDYGLGPKLSNGDTDLFLLRFAPPAP